jgi:signal transduction histidine kinase
MAERSEQHAAVPDGPPGDVYDLRWAIRLRWVAAAGILAGVLVAERVFGAVLEGAVVLATAGFIAIYNLFFHLLLAYRDVKRLTLNIRGLAAALIVLDLASLIVILHFTGGAENPFMFFFIFHAVISGITLPARFSFVQTALASSVFVGMIWLEYAGLLAHHPVGNFIASPLYSNAAYLACVSAVFVGLMFITLYLVSFVTRKIVDRDRILEEANLKLKRMDRIKSEYVLRVSHDIKGHLAAIQSCIHPVQAGFLGALSEGQKNLLDRAENRTGRLLLFVKALLNLTIARLKEGAGDETFDLSAAVGDAAELADPAARAKQIGIIREVPPGSLVVPGSRAEVQATLLELLSNAVKYSPPGGQVRIVMRRSADKALVLVSDSGVGIAPAELPFIFDEFYRSAKTAETDNGTGLGLAMAKHVVEKLGGRIWAESEENRGTSFHIELPVLKA